MNISDQRNNVEKDYENDFDDDDDADDRAKRAQLAANAALRRQSNIPTSAKTTTDVIPAHKFSPSPSFHLFQNDPSETPREDDDLRKLRTRLEQYDSFSKNSSISSGIVFSSFFRSANEERLQILEDNEKHLTKLKKDLRSEKEREEQILREKMREDLK